MQLTTENISLLFDTTSEPYSPHETLLDDLWNTLRKNAVEPGQASSPAFASFADECLLCAQIATTPKHSVRDKGGDQDVNALWGSQTPRSGCVVQTSTQPNIPSPLDSPLSSRAGLVYVHAGPANVTAGEANIGIILRPEMQRRGYAREAIQLVLRWAFEELKFHRVQAAILDSPCKDRALRLFIGLGFSHEGTRRRAVYQPEGDGIAGVWRDVTYLAMLDTEWVLRNVGKGKIPKQPVISVWDEMFARHAREQEQLLKWEENHGRMTRSASTETLREENRGTRDERELVDQITRFFHTEPSTSSRQSSAYGSVPPSPGHNIHVTLADEDLMADEMAGVEGLHSHSDLSQKWEEVLEARQLRQCISDRFQRWLDVSPSRRLALPSIPSTGISEGNPQSPLTIPSPSSPVSVPPRSHSPESSRGADAWSDSGSEDVLLSESAPRYSAETHRVAAAYSLHPRASTRSRRRSSSGSSSSSNDSWSDAHSGVDAGCSDWDMISDESSSPIRGVF